VPGTGSLTGQAVLLCKHPDVAREEGFIVRPANVALVKGCEAPPGDRFDLSSPNCCPTAPALSTPASLSSTSDNLEDIDPDSNESGSTGTGLAAPSSTTSSHVEDVDDDTVPLADNLPSTDDSHVKVVYAEGYSHSGFCKRCQELGGEMYKNAGLTSFKGDLNNEVDVFSLLPASVRGRRCLAPDK